MAALSHPTRLGIERVVEESFGIQNRRGDGIPGLLFGVPWPAGHRSLVSLRHHRVRLSCHEHPLN
ncbi:hypothetical protein FB570_111309 [Streptomyces sp. T12]|nr:hypothetical protein FB570_111309 [Streptomyces sp. T12]